MTVNLFVKTTMFTGLFPWKHLKGTLLLHVYRAPNKYYTICLSYVL